LKISKFFMVVAVLVVSAACTWADGIDPKVIIKKGGGSTPITLQDPNPSVTAPAKKNIGQCFDASAPACVFDVFQNQTGNTITSLTIFIPTLNNLIFSCEPGSLVFDFNGCTATNVSGGTNIFFFNSGPGSLGGVAPAVFGCVLDGDENDERHDDCDKKGYTGGEFAVDIEGAGVVRGTQIPLTAVTTPEPGSFLLMLVGALAFGLLGLVRKNVLA
jgi:hypothetical protein